MSGRGRRSRGRTPKSSQPRSLFLKKPRQNDSDNSNSNSRSSTPSRSATSTPTHLRGGPRGIGRSNLRDSAVKSRTFISKVMMGDDNSDLSDEFEDEMASYAGPPGWVAPQPGTESVATSEKRSDDQDSDYTMEDSLSEYSEAGSYTATPAKMRFPSLMPRRPETPPYIDPKDMPTLDLPTSSKDLPIDNEYLMQAVSLYEVLRHYRVILRVSPFRFEDFCVALYVDEQTCLLSEVQMALLRALQREEDGNNTTFGPQDIKDSINICMLFLDAMTWPELIRAYLDSDKSKDFQKAIPPLSNKDFCDMSVEDRLLILQTLIDLFLSSNAVRENILNEGNISYDDNCRNCHRSVLPSSLALVFEPWF